MTSGVTVAQAAIDTYTIMKVPPSHMPASERIRLCSFVIDKGEIVVEKLIRDRELSCGGEALEKFLELMERGACRYILYDCHYAINEGNREDMVFILWCSDDASIKQKMRYASSKDCFTKILNGVKCCKTFNDGDCSCMEDFASLILDKSVLSIEGQEMPHVHGPKGHGPKGHGPKGHGPKGHGPPGHGPHGHGPHGHDPHGHGPYGHDPHGHGPHGHDPHGPGPYGHDPHGHGPYGHDPHGHGPYGHDPHGHDPHGHGPCGHDPHGHDPHGDDPHGHDPHGHGPHGHGVKH